MTGWTDTIVGDEIELSYGKGLPTHERDGGAFPVFGSNGCVGHHSSALISGPGIIVGRKGSVGEVVFSQGDFWPIDTSYYVVNKAQHDWRFLFHLLSSLGLKKLNSHSAIPGLNREDVYSINISLPDVPEQRMIGQALDEVQLNILLQVEAITAARDLKRAAMRTLFTKGLRGEAQKDTEIGPVPESWDVVPLGRHYSAVSGGTPSRGNPGFWQDGTIPWVKTTEINYGVLTRTEEHITEAGLKGSAAKWLQAGTLLMAMYGQGVTRGKVAILGIDATCNQACAALWQLDESVDSIFLFHFLSWRYEEIRQLAHGGQQQNLNLDIVRALPIVRPPTLDEQREIVAVLDAIDRKIDLHRRKRALLDELFKALLHKLMTGEIRVADLDLSALEPMNAKEAAA